MSKAYFTPLPLQYPLALAAPARLVCPNDNAAMSRPSTRAE